jgi:hypothetical protein
MRLIPAIALDRPREVTTKYGQRLVIDCMARDTGEKITLWRGADDDYSRRYVIKNSPLTVGIDSKGKYSLVEDTALVNLGQPLPESPVPVRPVYNHKIEQSSESEQSFLNPSQKREIANYVTEMAKLYKYCLDQVDATIGVEGEDKRAIATTLYLSAQKKFSL